MSTLALELDQQEKQLMAQQGLTSQFMNYLKEGSNNVAEDGNFSIQVLSEALKRFDLYAESVDAKINLAQDLRYTHHCHFQSDELGFICNSSSHWFPIRRIDGIWYNLNSTNRGGPEIISDFYLSAFLQSIKEGGYTIFVVRGQFPSQENPDLIFGEYQPHQRWFTKQQVQAVHQKRLKKKNYKLNIGGTDERDYDTAIKRSMGKMVRNSDLRKEEEEEDDEEDWDKLEHPEEWQPEKQPLAPFQGSGVQIYSQKSEKCNYTKFSLNSSEDPELAFAILMSIESKFQGKVENGITVAFAMPDGKQVQHTFAPTTLVEDMYDFVLLRIPQGQSYEFLLQINMPRMVLNDVNLSLEQAGVEDMTLIGVIKQ